MASRSAKFELKHLRSLLVSLNTQDQKLSKNSKKNLTEDVEDIVSKIGVVESLSNDGEMQTTLNYFIKTLCSCVPREDSEGIVDKICESLESKQFQGRSSTILNVLIPLFDMFNGFHAQQSRIYCTILSIAARYGLVPSKMATAYQNVGHKTEVPEIRSDPKEAVGFASPAKNVDHNDDDLSPSTDSVKSIVAAISWAPTKKFEANYGATPSAWSNDAQEAPSTAVKNPATEICGQNPFALENLHNRHESIFCAIQLTQHVSKGGRDVFQYWVVIKNRRYEASGFDKRQTKHMLANIILPMLDSRSSPSLLNNTLPILKGCFSGHVSID